MTFASPSQTRNTVCGARARNQPSTRGTSSTRGAGVCGSRSLRAPALIQRSRLSAATGFSAKTPSSADSPPPISATTLLTRTTSARRRSGDGEVSDGSIGCGMSGSADCECGASGPARGRPGNTAPSPASRRGGVPQFVNRFRMLPDPVGLQQILTCALSVPKQPQPREQLRRRSAGSCSRSAMRIKASSARALKSARMIGRLTATGACA